MSITDGTGQEWDYEDSWAYKNDGDWTYGGVDCTDSTQTIADASCPYPICGIVVSGCTDETAFNYNPNASNEDGSCISVVIGCMNSGADNYDADVNTSCTRLLSIRRLYRFFSFFNYDSLANTNDGSCAFTLTNGLSLQGIMDLAVPSGGSDGKAHA